MKLSDKALKEMFQCEKIHSIPQADYHLDLFIRPLKDKKVLLADDATMLNTLQAGMQKLTDTILKTPANDREKFKNVYVKLGTYINGFKKIIQQNPYSKTEEVEKALIDAGYEPIKVPARLFEIYQETNKYFLKNLHNYINAHVHINDKNELVYITNKSNLDEILGLTPEMQKLTGISIEQAFLDAVKPHVDKVYFVSGNNNSIPKELLPEYFGGIHCMGMEVI